MVIEIVMKILIVYDSLFGYTKKIAYSIGEATSAQYETKIQKVDEITLQDIKDFDLLIVGSPTHGGRFTEPMKKFITALPEDSLKNMKVSTFDTSFPTTNMGFFINHVVKIFGNAAPRLAKEFEKKAAINLDSKIFYVLVKEGPLKDGEKERAKEWIDQIINTNRNIIVNQ